MLFVVIGLIILIVAFLIALVMLIRELSQRANIEDAIGDYSLELADEVVSTQSRLPDQPVLMQQPSIDPLAEDASFDEPSLDEVVPFPWVMENNSQSQNRKALEKPPVTEVASNDSIKGQNPVNLSSSFSISELVNKD